MGLFLTFKTVGSATWTLHIILLNNGRFLTKELTMFRGTVTYEFINDAIIDTDFPFIQF